MNDVATSREIYQFRIVVRDTSPHVWRRMQVCRSINPRRISSYPSGSVRLVWLPPFSFSHSRESARNQLSWQSGLTKRQQAREHQEPGGSGLNEPSTRTLEG